ncbi:MAG: type II secretion system F family protein [Woeseia sp.]
MALQYELEDAPAAATADSSLAGRFAALAGHRKVKPADRMFFTEQLALLLETGESLHEALKTIVSQTESPAMREIVEKLATDVRDGQSFGQALSRHEEVFSTTYVNLIVASEAGGFMYQVLLQLLDMEKKRETLRNTLVSAGTYPLFLIGFSFAVVAFVLIVVFPKFATMFASIYDQLPASTRVLMAASELLRHYWLLLALGIAAVVVVLRQWLASGNGHEKIDYLKLHLPVMRDVFTQIYLVQACQVLSLSLSNRVSVMESLAACRDVVRNSLFRQLISNVEQKVQSGAGLASGFAESSIVPQLAKHLIATGERTGNLGPVMGRISEYYEAQLKKKLDTLSKLAEPIMLLIMGVVVGVLVSSLILPIFKLSRAVS